MHKSTKAELETLARWTEETVAADHFAILLEDCLPASRLEEGGMYHALGNDFGVLGLNVYNADSVHDSAHYLRATRLAGFKRAGDVEESPSGNSVSWRYTLKDDGREIRLTVTLHFRVDENASCQYVQVGEKTVPDMKLLCGDELKEWQALDSGKTEKDPTDV